jgi:hypothetical protein
VFGSFLLHHSIYSPGFLGGMGKMGEKICSPTIQ